MLRFPSPDSLAADRSADGISLIETAITDLQTDLQLLLKRLTERRDAIASQHPDAAHFLKDLEEQALEFSDRLETAECANATCHSLGVWLHPETLNERYCQSCKEHFGPCGICGQTMRLEDGVGDPIGHEVCHGGE